MIPLGLSAADRAAYEATLTQSHRIRVAARIHDHDERVIHTFSGSILSGSVQVDASGTGPLGRDPKDSPIRTLDLTVLLPRRNPAWLPDGPGDEAVFANNFVSVLYGVWVEDLAGGPGWVDVPVFWGPVTGLDQDGDQVTIAGSGKEVLGLDPAVLWAPMTIRKGTLRTTAVRDVLGAQGEARFDLPEIRSRVTSTWSLNRHTQPWKTAVRVAKYGDRQLFYDGAGRARMRRNPGNRSWTFKGGEQGSLLSKPRVSYDIGSVVNTVEVLGGRAKGAPRRVREVAQAPASHPLSSWTLRRNGQRRYLVHFEENDVTSAAKARDIAERILTDSSTATVHVEFDCLPVPHLEEFDRVGVVVPDTWASGDRTVEGAHIEFSVQAMTIPLTSGDPMSIGVNRRVSWRRRRRGPVYRWGA